MKSVCNPVLETIFVYSWEIFWSNNVYILHNLLTNNTLRKITQDVLVRCLGIVSNLNAKLARHFQNLVGHCLVTDCCFQHCYPVLT